ncbi:DNA-methyltransferase [Bacteroides sp. AM10-21B]|uniref:DNA-methyltransferase n=1 Tax=Bacteroides sp. AM10-21B TaxID=2292001 RepID=UPI000E49DE44|nr:site-specific DNA-methyltransferase [Bacteroides sp. AM10-21B]RHJ49017.1 site-specific DNA-methyltransferase [Bacteroides sp. AM10-21B]
MVRTKNGPRSLYRVNTTEDAKKIGMNFLKEIELDKVINFGLPEIDDRFDIWRIPLKSGNDDRIGEIVIDAITTFVDRTKTTDKELLENRLLGRNNKKKAKVSDKNIPKISMLRNTIGMGDSEELLRELPKECVDLVFTSPPYYNAKPEYAEYLSYEDYLLKMQKIIHECARVLNEGRFFVLNVSPVLLRRASRSEASKRIAVPFDFHRLFIEEGFEFVDDIIWVKPEGAGWATGRGRRFAADRNPLQYKPVPVTEYVLVYRKKTDKLIDWLIRKHPDQTAVRNSKIEDGYETTNIWKIHPAHCKEHPAIFPIELAEKVIKYYSFEHDVILDPFGGIGTTGKAAKKMGRRFVLFEKESQYIQRIKKDVRDWFIGDDFDINWINVDVNKNEFNNTFSRL